MPLRDYEHMQLPEGVTPEEARWYSDQRQSDIRQALKAYSKRALVGFIVLLIGVGLALFSAAAYNRENDKQADQNRQAIVESGRAVSVAGCNRDFKTISALRGILLRAQVSVENQHKAGIISDSQARRAQDYYRRSLDDLQLPDCRQAGQVITDNPDAPVRVPEPSYPGGPTDPEAG